MSRKRSYRGMRPTKSGSWEGYGVIHKKDGETIEYSVTRKTKEEILDIKARIRILGILDEDVEKIKVMKYTNEIVLIKKGTNEYRGQLNKNMTTKQYFHYYIWEHRRRGVNGKIIKDTTISGYMDRGKFIIEEIGNVKVRDLTFDILDKAVQNISKRASDSTTRQVRDLITSMMKFAKKDGLIDTNILLEDKLTIREKKGKKEKKIMDREDEKKFIQYCLEHKYTDMLTLMFTGVRVSELAGLTWDNLDEKEKTLHVEKEYMRVKKQEYTDGQVVVKKRTKEITDLKTRGSDRIIGIENILELLLEHKERQKLLAKKLGKKFKETDFIFTTKSYNGYLGDFTYDKFKKIVKILELKNYQELTPHCLRHTFCSRRY